MSTFCGANRLEHRVGNMAQQSHPRCVAQSPFRDAASRDHFHLWPFALFRCRAVSRSRSGKSRHRTARKPAESVENDPWRSFEGLQAATLSICEEQPVYGFEPKGSLAGQRRGFELSTVIRIGSGKSNAKNLS